MAFDPDFLRLFTNVVTHFSDPTRNFYGEVIDGTRVNNIPAHISYSAKILRSDEGEVVTSSAQIEIPPPGYVVGGVTVPSVADDDRFILPDGAERTILSVEQPTDEDGTIFAQSIALL